jgi:hypothetical protein
MLFLAQTEVGSPSRGTVIRIEGTLYLRTASEGIRPKAGLSNQKKLA